MKTFKQYQLIILLLGLVLYTGCEDVLKEDAYSILTEYNFYEDENDAIIAVNGVYRGLTDRDNSLTENNNYGYAGNLLMMNKLSDINYNDGAKENYGGPIAIASMGEDDVVSGNIWAFSYMIINRANNVLNNVPNIEMDSVVQQRVLGEARFLRALAYFNLVKFWGRVPLHLEETRDFESETIHKSRNSIADVFAVIVDDLEFAEKSLYFKFGTFDLSGVQLPSDLPEEAIGSVKYNAGDDNYQIVVKMLKEKDKGRATVGAARALLARVYLFMGSMKKYGKVSGYDFVDYFSAYQKTREYCQKVIDQSNYTLLDNYQRIFATDNKYNDEMIFEIAHSDQIDLHGGIYGYWHSGSTRIAARPEYILLFEESFDMTTKFFVDSLTDARLYYSVNMRPDKDKIMITKYGYSHDSKEIDRLPEHLRFINWWGNSFNNPVNVPYIRYADVLLMMAEAINEIEGPGRAYEFVNQVRARARRSNIYSTRYPVDLFGLTQEEFRNQVWDERKRELAFELHSFSDLVRTGTIIEKISATKYISQSSMVFQPEFWDNAEPSVISKNISETDQLFPVPLRERDINPNLDQNPGYGSDDN